LIDFDAPNLVEMLESGSEIGVLFAPSKSFVAKKHAFCIEGYTSPPESEKIGG
jgi:hypothetical protein